jgi:hypothetical protein
MIEPLFAWSWHGHGRLTALALAAAITQVARLGKSDLWKRLLRLYASYITQMRQERGGQKHGLYKDVGTDPEPSSGQVETALGTLLAGLPGMVQRADLHPGNIPWGVGEFLDSNGQVRHFMRSTQQTTEAVAYANSMGWIRSHLTLSWEKFKSALYTDYGFLNFFSSNFLDFLGGLSALAEGLHTVEDSYAPGHAGRLPSLHSVITTIHYWDAENKTAHGDWPGHEALDNPDNSISAPFFNSAGETTTELIVCILANLDGDHAAFNAALERRLGVRFHLSLGAFEAPEDSPSASSGVVSV